MGIYKITNPHNGKCYIGSSRNIRNRIIRHASSFKSLTCNKKFIEDIEQSPDFICEILEKIPYGENEQYLLSRERYYAGEVFKSVGTGYNVAYVCDSLSSKLKEVVIKRTTPITDKEAEKKPQTVRTKTYKKERRIGRYTGFM